MKKRLFILLFSIVLCSCNSNTELISKQLLLNKDWQFQAVGDTGFFPAKVPGEIHLDLLDNGLIPDPFVGNNEEKLQWIGEKEWLYQVQFYAEDRDFYQNIDLVFEGLDTHAQVYLNDSLILEAHNMFRKWTIPIRNLIRKENNQLKIIFASAEKYNREQASKLPYQLPDERVFSRKAPYQFGWDWGPRLITAGVWKRVYINLWNQIQFKQVQIVQGKMDAEKVEMQAICELKSENQTQYQYRIVDTKNQKVYSEGEIEIEKGLQKIQIPFTIQHPKLWWCNGMGEAHLYPLKIEILNQKHQIVESKSIEIGIRTIEWVQEPDQKGRSFYLKLNGRPVFAKGANYVPSDNFLTRVDSNQQKSLIESAIWANMNMIRVWGGGIYESDEFYHLCDKNGLLVWQDFMFACAMYPGDSSFVENVKQEAIEQVIRLRNHPSIALWCGNNEVDNGWQDWGWQKQFAYSKSDSTSMANDYQKVFRQVLPDIINKFDSSRAYWPSSPLYGWGHEENFTMGDSHYWGVWWGMEPFSAFNTKVGRFMSEYGFQALPDFKTIQYFADSSEWFLESESMKHHQKHPTGYQTIQTYLERSYKTPALLSDYVYVSQLLQAEGIKTAIEAHRRNQPYCMGSLYWQLNDSWPVTSWSSIDYFHRKKALHYFVKEAFQSELISTIREHDTLNIYLISNNLEDQKVKLITKQFNFYGQELYADEKELLLKQNTSFVASKKPIKAFKWSRKSVIYSELWKGDQLLDLDYFYLEEPKFLELPMAKIETEILETNRGYTVLVKSNVLAKNIQLAANIEGDFSENYFDILPMQDKAITFVPKENGTLKLTFKVLNNLYQK